MAPSPILTRGEDGDEGVPFTLTLSSMMIGATISNHEKPRRRDRYKVWQPRIMGESFNSILLQQPQRHLIAV
jgi:hypothetical protein